MYSPADFPSRWRAAPAKKRRLSVENGISSREAISGFPTLRDSSCASSSAFASSTSASLCSSSERSLGVVSSHAGRAFCAASTARSTSSAPQAGTSAMTSPVAGLITSIVSPEAASTNSPPMNALYVSVVVLIGCPPWSTPVPVRASYGGDLCGLYGLVDACRAAEHPGVAHEALREEDRDRRHDDHRERDHVHDRQLLAEPDVTEDEERERVLRSRGEGRDDDLVEGQGEGEEPARDERGGEDGPDDEAKRLPAVRAEILRRFDERRRRAPQPREHVVVDDHDAEGRVTDDDRPQRQVDVARDESRVERDAGDDARERDREHEEERHGLTAEEAEAVHSERRGGAEHERDTGGDEPDPDGQPKRLLHLRRPGRMEPVGRERWNRPALDVRLVERVEHDQRERDPEKQDHERRPKGQRDARRPLFHYRASKAPSLRAIRR